MGYVNVMEHWGLPYVPFDEPFTYTLGDAEKVWTMDQFYYETSPIQHKLCGDLAYEAKTSDHDLR